MDSIWYNSSYDPSIQFTSTNIPNRFSEFDSDRVSVCACRDVAFSVLSGTSEELAQFLHQFEHCSIYRRDAVSDRIMEEIYHCKGQDQDTSFLLQGETSTASPLLHHDVML